MDGPARVRIDTLLAVHAVLGERYLEALREYDSGDPLARRRVDAAVRGIDRAPTDAMEHGGRGKLVSYANDF